MVNMVTNNSIGTFYTYIYLLILGYQVYNIFTF